MNVHPGMAKHRILMGKSAFFIFLFFVSSHAFGQNAEFHYVKFIHVGEQLLPVHALNVSCGNGDVPSDSAELVNDTLQSVSIVTDKDSYESLQSYLKYTDYKLAKDPGALGFGTFKMISDNNRYYIPGPSVTPYFKKMVKYLKKKKADPQLIQTIIDNYPWIFNP